MVNCQTCGNTRKVEFENKVITCPVCEDYVLMEDIEDAQ